MFAGLGWAAVAYLFGARTFGAGIWGGLVAAPLIGVAVGWLTQIGFENATGVRRGLVALTSLYLGAVLFGLGIPHVGSVIARSLARHFGSLAALQAAAAEDIAAVPGVGMVIAEAVVTWFGDPDHQALAADLAAAGVRLELSEDERPPADGHLTGKTFVLTGTLSVPRGEVERRIVEAGGTMLGSVSAKTDYVVAGAAAGSKLAKASKLGVELLDEAALEALLQP